MRIDKRLNDQPRSCTIVPNFMQTAYGSCLISTGNTKVICTASVEETVPNFLKGCEQGWITAEYAMLPASTSQRKTRDGIRKDSRSVEIQRLIGRSLRQAVDLKKLGERTITLDCDVLQADGGTRTASITGAYVALVLAIHKLMQNGLLQDNPIAAQVAAISAGVVNGETMLDLCYMEDSNAMTDMNVVMNHRGEYIELQGTAEGKPFSKRELNVILALGQKGVRSLMKIQREVLDACGAGWLLPPIKLVVATGNMHKLREMQSLFGSSVELVTMKEAGFDQEIDECGNSFEENAAIKAEAVCHFTGLPSIADDSGLCVDALNGAPGIFSARYAGLDKNDVSNNELLLRNMEGQTERGCAFVCSMALALPGEATRVVRGECRGTLLKEADGTGGFGYDPLFMHPSGNSFGRMSEKEKNEISHRAVASRLMRDTLHEVFG